MRRYMGRVKAFAKINPYATAGGVVALLSTILEEYYVVAAFLVICLYADHELLEQKAHINHLLSKLADKDNDTSVQHTGDDALKPKEE